MRRLMSRHNTPNPRAALPALQSQVRVAVADPDARFVVCGLSAEFWQVKSLTVTVIGLNHAELHTAELTLEPTPKGDKPEFTARHLTIPTNEPAMAVVMEIKQGAPCVMSRACAVGAPIAGLDGWEWSFRQGVYDAVVCASVWRVVRERQRRRGMEGECLCVYACVCACARACGVSCE
jgi:hypothetical protein